MITVNDVQLMTYRESKKVAKFYKKVDRKIMRAAKKGRITINVPNCGFGEKEVLNLLKLYVEEGYEISRRSVATIYNPDIFICFALWWDIAPDIQFEGEM